MATGQELREQYPIRSAPASQGFTMDHLTSEVAERSNSPLLRDIAARAAGHRADREQRSGPSAGEPGRQLHRRILTPCVVRVLRRLAGLVGKPEGHQLVGQVINVRLLSMPPSAKAAMPCLQ